MSFLKYFAFAVLLIAAQPSRSQERIDTSRLNSLYRPQMFDGMPCRVMNPFGFNTNRKYPVIVSLHGAGGRGTKNNKQLKDWNRQLAEDARRRAFPCYVVAPQANELWNHEHLSKIKALIKKLPAVDNDRIYIMGHSMGGHGTYIFIQLDGEYFAAAAPSAGSGKKSTEDFIDADKIKDLPIWAFHGDKDGVCPIAKDVKVFDDVKQLGGNMKLTTWAGDNHGVSGKMIPGANNGTTQFSSKRCDKEPDFMTWLFSQSRELKELDHQVAEIQDLIERINKISGQRELRRDAQYLNTTIAKLRELKKLRGKLIAMPEDTSESTRDKTEKRVDDLKTQIGADEELVGLLAKVTRANADDIEDAAGEISELRRELESENKTKSSDPIAETPDIAPLSEDTSRLKTGQYFIRQSWSQESNFRRPYHVTVPKSDDEERKLPVLIFLHGNGGNAIGAKNGFMRHRRTIASQYITVFAQGYRESWNIVSERSKADDLGFIEAIVSKLAQCENVDSNNFTIMGASNGAALVNQLAIESKLPNIRSYISGVSPLNVWQYDGKQFKAKGDDNHYRLAVTPAKGKRLMNISGVQDKLVPYAGGFSKAIPAKDGKLAFVAAEESTFLWAKHFGYTGVQLAKPTKTSRDMDVFSYLGGDVVHYKVKNEGHGAVHGISEAMLLHFLQGGEHVAQDQ